MAKNNQQEEFFEDENFGEDVVVELTDSEGNTYYYTEELVIPVGEDRFAILVGIPDEGEEHNCSCGHHHCEDEDCDCGDEDVIIAKIVLNADGEEEYIEPTDEEFEAVQAAYEQLMDESEEEE